MDLKELYQEIILDHGKNPRNLRKAENFNKDAQGHNPLCGDKVHLSFYLDENDIINDTIIIITYIKIFFLLLMKAIRLFFLLLISCSLIFKKYFFLLEIFYASHLYYIFLQF